MRGRTRRAPPRTARAGRTRCRGCTRRSRTPGRGATRGRTPGSRPRAGRGRRARRRSCSRGCGLRIRRRPRARSNRWRPRTRARRRARCPGGTPPPLGRGPPSAGGPPGRRPGEGPSTPHQPRGRFNASAVAVSPESTREPPSNSVGRCRYFHPPPKKVFSTPAGWSWCGLPSMVWNVVGRPTELSRHAPFDCVWGARVSTMDVESFSKTKAMELPRNVVVGHDAVHQAGEVCQSLKLGKRALIVADETTMKIAGAIVEKELGARKVKTAVYLIPDATMAEVREAEEKIRKGTVDFALGVGGGRPIDVAKCASFNGGVSSRASIQKDGERVSLAAQTPIAVIMDTAIIAESPFRLLAAGCGDIISNRVAVSIAGSSRPASGSEHKFSHALDRLAKKPALHGEQCGVGTIMMMYLHGGKWEEVREALLAIGAPTTARSLGVTDDEVLRALVHAHEVNKERYTILGDEGLTVEAAERLAKITKVI